MNSTNINLAELKATLKEASKIANEKKDGLCMINYITQDKHSEEFGHQFLMGGFNVSPHMVIAIFSNIFRALDEQDLKMVGTLLSSEIHKRGFLREITKEAINAE